MKNRLLFFDIECANCYGGDGKICSFGYVLCDDDFHIVECDDIIINPQSRFDWALFSSKIECSLSYPVETFLAAPTFPTYGQRISDLLAGSSGRIIGFAPKNDIGFLAYTFHRYNLTLPEIVVADLVSVLHSEINENMRLTEWGDRFAIDKSSLTAHNSLDDAKLTMLIFKAFCQKYQTTPAAVLQKIAGTLINSTQYIAQRKHKRDVKLYKSKIMQLYAAGHSEMKQNKLGGKKYRIMLKKNSEPQTEYELALSVCRNGGLLVRRGGKDVVIVTEDKRVAGLLASGKLKAEQIIGISEFKKRIK